MVKQTITYEQAIELINTWTSGITNINTLSEYRIIMDNIVAPIYQGGHYTISQYEAEEDKNMGFIIEGYGKDPDEVYSLDFKRVYPLDDTSIIITITSNFKQQGVKKKNCLSLANCQEGTKVHKHQIINYYQLVGENMASIIAREKTSISTIAPNNFEIGRRSNTIIFTQEIMVSIETLEKGFLGLNELSEAPRRNDSTTLEVGYYPNMNPPQNYPSKLVLKYYYSENHMTFYTPLFFNKKGRFVTTLLSNTNYNFYPNGPWISDIDSSVLESPTYNEEAYISYLKANGDNPTQLNFKLPQDID